MLLDGTIFTKLADWKTLENYSIEIIISYICFQVVYVSTRFLEGWQVCSKKKCKKNNF